MNTQTNTSVTTKSTRGRKFEAAKWSMKRAWDISRNAAVSHNTNPIKVSEIGLVKPSEYFQESLKLAWKEAKAKINNTPYSAYKMHNVPKKSVPTILNAIAKFAIVKNLCKAENKTTNEIINLIAKKSHVYSMELGELILNTRYSTAASKYNNSDVINAFNELKQGQLF